VNKFALILWPAALGSGLLLEGSFGHQLFLMVAALGLILFGILLGLWSALAVRRQTWQPWHSSCWRAIRITAAALAISWTAGTGMHAWRVHQTRSYVARAVTVLDAHHSKTGAYPSAFSLETIGKPPQWLSGPQTCTVTPQDFRFEYWDPAGMMDGFEFTSTHRSWTAFD
jgi:hypothetical protein